MKSKTEILNNTIQDNAFVSKMMAFLLRHKCDNILIVDSFTDQHPIMYNENTLATLKQLWIPGAFLITAECFPQLPISVSKHVEQTLHSEPFCLPLN